MGNRKRKKNRKEKDKRKNRKELGDVDEKLECKKCMKPQQSGKCENVDKETDRHVLSLDFSQRKERFLIVTTVMGVLIFVLKYLMQMSVKLFGRLYLHNINVFGMENVFISWEQIMSIIYMSSCICIIGVFLIYCICELYNLQSLKNDLKMQVAADRWYALVFEIAFILLISNLVISMLMLYWFSDNKMLFYVFIVSIILIIGLAINGKKEKWNTTTITLIIKTIMGNILLSIFLFIIIFMVAQERQGTMIAHFDKENIILEFQGGYYPDEILCRISDGNSILEEMYVFDNCGECAWIEKISATEKGKDDSTNIKENYYYYKCKMDISDMHQEGKYVIEIVYTINNTEYRVRNTFYYDGKYTYTQKEMKTDL